MIKRIHKYKRSKLFDILSYYSYSEFRNIITPPSLLRAFATRPTSPGSPFVSFSHWSAPRRPSSLPRLPESCDNPGDRSWCTLAALPIEEDICISVERASASIHPKESQWGLSSADTPRRTCYNDCAGRALAASPWPLDDCCNTRSTYENLLSEKINSTRFVFFLYFISLSLFQCGNARDNLVNNATNVTEKAFADAALVWRVPVDAGLEILQELGLKVQQLLEIDKDGLDLFLAEHICAPATFRDVALGHIAQHLHKVTFGLHEFADHAGSHLFVREQRNARSSPQLSTRGSSRCHRG